jgi:hypothetical protein
MTAVADIALRAPAAVFVPIDMFLAPTVPGPALGLDRLPRSALRFGVLTATFGGTPTTMPADWWLVTTRTASGAYVTYGELEGPDRVRRWLIGAATRVTLSIESRFYRPQPNPLDVPLQNLDPDPAVPRAGVTPTVVEMHPGVLYPFPTWPGGYGIVRGLVARSTAGRGVDQITITATAPPSGSTPALLDSYITEHGGQFVFAVPDAGRAARRVTLSAAGAAAVGVDVPPSGSATTTTILIP